MRHAVGVHPATQPSPTDGNAPLHSRYSALDGLRGIAALVVVVHHVLLLSPSLAGAYRGERVEGWEAWLTYTPLHLVWAGGEAVLVFFVLSGFVLALPAAQGRPLAWRAYYPQRLLRLYVPVFAAVVLALPQAMLLRPSEGASGSWWWLAHADSGGLRDAAQDATLVFGTHWLNSALWSLQWEVVFSLALPIFLLLLRARWSLIVGAALFALLAAGTLTGRDSLKFLPMFALGVLLCRHRDRLSLIAKRHGIVLLAVGAALLLTPWYEAGTAAGFPFFGSAAALGLKYIGALMVVVSFIAGPVARLTQSQRQVQWLGRRSFSLYLVHEPLAVSAAFLTGSQAPWLLLLIAVPVSLVVAEVFGQLVEGPSHRLSRRVGARVREMSVSKT